MRFENPVDKVKRLKKVRPRWEQDERVPPGQTVTKKFPVLHYGPVPKIDLETWGFRLFGLVEEPVHFNWDEFRSLSATTVDCDIHCVTRWSKLDTTWEGVRFRDLLQHVKVLPQATHIMAHCEHGFTTNLPLEAALDDDVLLAWHFDGKPLEQFARRDAQFTHVTPTRLCGLELIRLTKPVHVRCEVPSAAPKHRCDC